MSSGAVPNAAVVAPSNAAGGSHADDASANDRPAAIDAATIYSAAVEAATKAAAATTHGLYNGLRDRGFQTVRYYEGTGLKHCRCKQGSTYGQWSKKLRNPTQRQHLQLPNLGNPAWIRMRQRPYGSAMMSYSRVGKFP
jgi:hypothetical protein